MIPTPLCPGFELGVVLVEHFPRAVPLTGIISQSRLDGACSNNVKHAGF